ncbi:MAG TPA: helix-turn-helix domain-containing protein [Micromonosporaceae bacterium]|nr:helix-turn-helix domain-containing protein [Micromonosporaceae bacterium]
MVVRRRHRLAERRRNVGLSQERLAEIVGVDRSTVVRWEGGGTDPQPWHRPGLARALDLSTEQLAELLAHQGHTAPTWRAAGAPPPDGVAGELVVGGAGDLATVVAFRTADRQVGGRSLYPMVAGYLQYTVAPRLFGHAPDSMDGRVFAAAAGLTEMAGWMAHDAGSDRLAAQHFHQALGLARAGQDHQLHAHVHASLSHLAHHTGHPQDGLAHAQRGHAQLAQGQPHPPLQARLLAMQARGHAATGRQDLCLDTLRQAERVLASSLGGLLSPWVSTFDEASLAVETARCLCRLGQLRAARGQVEQVVLLRPGERARSRALARLMLVSILAFEGEPEHACAVAQEVLDTTRTLGSYLVLRQLEQLPQQLARYRGNRQVATFLEHLGTQLRERCGLPHWASSPSGPATGAI